jgi:hypothetical protein
MYEIKNRILAAQLVLLPGKKFFWNIFLVTEMSVGHSLLVGQNKLTPPAVIAKFRPCPLDHLRLFLVESYQLNFDTGVQVQMTWLEIEAPEFRSVS